MKSTIFKILQELDGELISSWKSLLAKNLYEGHPLSNTDLPFRQLLEMLRRGLDLQQVEEIEQAEFLHLYNLLSEYKTNIYEIKLFFSLCKESMLNLVHSSLSKDMDQFSFPLEKIFDALVTRYLYLQNELHYKDMSLERDRLALNLELNQQYLKNILHSTDTAIMVIDKDEAIIAWNKGAENIFGYTEQEVLGKPSSILLMSDEKYSAELDKIRTETFKQGYYNIPDTKRITKDGRVVNVSLNVTKLTNKEGDYQGRSVIIRDVTDIVKLKQQVDQSEKLAVIGQLAAGIAHEIGNPLTSISSIVQILQRRASDPFFSEQLANVKSNIDRISKIVRELVDFSRPPGHEEHPVQINDIIRTALGIVKYDKRVKNVQFNTDLNDNLPKIQVIPDQLVQVFVNILLNALDAIEGTGSIDVISRHDDEYAYIDFVDNGCGMSREVMSKLFDPFFTTKEVGKGTGLGLSVSYGIIKKFRGDILAASELNSGSCFTVKLPILK